MRIGIRIAVKKAIKSIKEVMIDRAIACDRRCRNRNAIESVIEEFVMAKQSTAQ